jgi:hypothetical protein
MVHEGVPYYGDFEPISFGGCAKVLSHLHEVSVGHNAIFDARLFTGNDEIVSNVCFRRMEGGHSFPNANSKRMRVELMELDAGLFQRITNATCIKLKVGQSLVGIGVLSQLGFAGWREESHNCSASYNNNGLLLRSCDTRYWCS